MIQIKISIGDMVLNLLLVYFFSLSNFDWDENVNIFGVDSSSSVRIDNKKEHLSSW